MGARAAAALTMPPLATAPLRLLDRPDRVEDPGADLGHRPVRVRGQQQRGDAGDVGLAIDVPSENP